MQPRHGPETHEQIVAHVDNVTEAMEQGDATKQADKLENTFKDMNKREQFAAKTLILKYASPATKEFINNPAKAREFQGLLQVRRDLRKAAFMSGVERAFPTHEGKAFDFQDPGVQQLIEWFRNLAQRTPSKEELTSLVSRVKKDAEKRVHILGKNDDLYVFTIPKDNIMRSEDFAEMMKRIVGTGSKVITWLKSMFKDFKLPSAPGRVYKDKGTVKLHKIGAALSKYKK